MHFPNDTTDSRDEINARERPLEVSVVTHSVVSCPFPEYICCPMTHHVRTGDNSVLIAIQNKSFTTSQLTRVKHAQHSAKLFSAPAFEDIMQLLDSQPQHILYLDR